MLRLDRPWRMATTSSRSVGPSGVSPTKASRRTLLGPANPVTVKARATRSARPASPGEPARRLGKAATSSRSELRGGGSSLPKVRPASKASGARRVVRGAPGSDRENASTNSATSAGRNAAR